MRSDINKIHDKDCGFSGCSEVSRNNVDKSKRYRPTSDIIKKGIERAPSRALMCALGVSDFSKPIVSVVNSWNEYVPGHIHLRKIGEEVKRGIRDAGGVPLEFDTIGICDGVPMGTPGMRYSLPSRDHIADSVEIMLGAQPPDGAVYITGCDKNIPGLLMGAARMDVPSIFVTAGPMKAGMHKGNKLDIISVFEAVGKVKAGKMDEDELEEIVTHACPGAGHCAGLFTASTMSCLTEVLGLSLTGCGTALAESEKKLKLAYESGKKVMDLIMGDTRPSDILTPDVFDNAIMVDMAIGGSTNSALHLPAIAAEVGIDLPVERFDEIAKVTPNICHIRPAGPYFMEDLENAGGIPAVLNRLESKLKDAGTVNGKSIIRIAKDSKVLDSEVIRSLDNPYAKEGGIAVLKGNLSSSSVIKQTAVEPEMMKHSGPAKVFYEEKSLLDAIGNGKISEGDVIVLPYQGVKGAPGMPEMLTPTSAIMGAGYKEVVLITDGRFSGGTRGPCIGHIEPEGYSGGLIGLVKDGDIIDIDIPNRKLDVRLSEGEINKRKKEMKAPYRGLTPFLKRYRDREQ